MPVIKKMKINIVKGEYLRLRISSMVMASSAKSQKKVGYRWFHKIKLFNF